jgi:hypothetical protein
VKPLIFVIGSLYGLAGLGSLVPLVMLLLYGPDITIGAEVIWYAFPLLNATVCGLLAYGVLKLRRWGRRGAIAYNGLWLTLTAFGLAYSRLIERPAATWTLRTSAFLIVVGGFLIGVIVLCSTERIKRLMST